MPNVWFTADTHHGHGRILEYCKRPFQSHEEQDEVMLQRFNEVIKPGDRLYHLGDVSWSNFDLDKFYGRLKTREVHLIYGNHDTEKRTKHKTFRSYSYIKNLSLDDRHLILCHYAMRSWLGRGRGAYQLYGHSHGQLPGEGRQMDVGVDTHNFYPWAWEEIKERLDAVPFRHEDETRS